MEITSGSDGHPLETTIVGYWCEACHIGIVPRIDPWIVTVEADTVQDAHSPSELGSDGPSYHSDPMLAPTTEELLGKDG